MHGPLGIVIQDLVCLHERELETRTRDAYENARAKRAATERSAGAHDETRRIAGEQKMRIRMRARDESTRTRASARTTRACGMSAESPACTRRESTRTHAPVGLVQLPRRYHAEAYGWDSSVSMRKATGASIDTATVGWAKRERAGLVRVVPSASGRAGGHRVATSCCARHNDEPGLSRNGKGPA